eukprot:5330583-Ditylum_brightwellii.AAC.1
MWEESFMRIGGIQWVLELRYHLACAGLGMIGRVWVMDRMDIAWVSEMKVPNWAKQCAGVGASRTSGPGTAVGVGGQVGNSIAKAAIGEGLTLGKRTCC